VDFNSFKASYSRRPRKRLLHNDFDSDFKSKKINSINKLDYFYKNHNNDSGFLNNKQCKNKYHSNSVVTNLDYFFNVDFDIYSEHCSELDYFCQISDHSNTSVETQPGGTKLDSREGSYKDSNNTCVCIDTGISELDKF
jgi:hypothetical protein